jgi:hypothetical protein
MTTGLQHRMTHRLLLQAGAAREQTAPGKLAIHQSVFTKNTQADGASISILSMLVMFTAVFMEILIFVNMVVTIQTPTISSV